MTINEVNGAGQPQNGYTKVTVKDKDSGESFVIDFRNARVKGNVAEWTIKDLSLIHICSKTSLTLSSPTTKIPIIIGIAAKNNTPTPLLK